MPTAIDDVTEAELWLQATLSAHNGVAATFGTRISTHPAPRRIAYPMCTYQSLAPSDDTLLVGAATFWSNLRFLVRGIVEGDDRTQLTAGVAAIKDALHGKYGGTANAQIVSCIRLRPFQMYELQDSKPFFHLGGEYAVRVRSWT